MADVELLPCPFCGAGKTEIRENGRPWLGMRYGDPSSVSVRHWCEPIEGQPSRMIERVGRDRAAAIAAWNTRATDANLAALQAENERLRAEVEEWKRVASAQAELHGESEARAERLAEALRDAHEALADAANTMYGIFGESQFCDSCTAFERANQWRQDWHGGDPLLQQITDALEQESNDARGLD